MSDLRVTQISTIPAAAAVPVAGTALGVGTLNRVELPADIGGATTMTFQVSSDGVTYRNLYDMNGNEYRLGAGAVLQAGAAYGVDPSLFVGVQWIIPRFGTSAAPATYANARAVGLVQVNAQY